MQWFYTISSGIKLSLDCEVDELRELSNIILCRRRYSGADNWLVMQLCDVAGASSSDKKWEREIHSITKATSSPGHARTDENCRWNRVPMVITAQLSGGRTWSRNEILGKIMIQTFSANPFFQFRLLHVIDFSRMWISNDINGLGRFVSGITESTVRYASNVMSLPVEWLLRFPI